MAASTDLAELVERLRTAGFRVDTRQYLTAHELLLTYAARGRPLEDTASLASHLGPIFCSQPEEQKRFAQEVAAWRGEAAAAPAPSRQAPVAPPARWRHWHHAFAAMALLVALSLGAGWLVLREYRDVVIEARVIADRGSGKSSPARGALVVFDGKRLEVDDTGRFRIVTRRVDGDRSLEVELPGYTPLVRSVDASTPSPLVLTLRPRPRAVAVDPASPITIGERRDVVLGAPKRYTLTGTLRWPLIAGGSIATATLLLALLVGADVNRRRVALKRLQSIGDPEELTLSPPRRDAVQITEHALRRIASGLRRPQRQAIADLEAHASVEATARAGGRFTPVYVPRRALPEYLVLVQQHSAGDHWSAWVHEWLDRLAANGVHIERFTFDGDPRTVHGSDAKRRPHRLADLVAHHHRASLLVFAETEVCIDPMRGRLHEWLDIVRPLPRRVLFTPEAPYRWTRDEWTVAAEGFVVLPAGEAGLQAFAALTGEWRIEPWFPARYAREYPRLLAGESQRWLDRNAPPESTIDTLVRQLRGYLGPAGFAWLCACAAYPQLSWPLTLQLGALPSLGVDAHTILPLLARLPWLRHAFMPDWLRDRLLGELTPGQDAEVRTMLESLLGRLVLASPSETVSATDPRTDAGALKIARWVAPLDLMRAAPPASPLRDRVFLGFVAGETRERLLLRVGSEVLSGFSRAAVGMLPSQPSSSTTARPVRVMLCYRREDAGPWVGRLVDSFTVRALHIVIVGDKPMAPGTDVASWLDAELPATDAMLVVIGPTWQMMSAGKRSVRDLVAQRKHSDFARDDAAGEFVFRQIAAALERRMTIIPVLVGGATMPPGDSLPPECQALVRYQALELPDDDWHGAIDRLIAALPGPSLAYMAEDAPRRRTFVDRARLAAVQGHLVAQRVVARARTWLALHPWQGAVASSLVAGVLAFLALRALLPESPVEAHKAVPFIAFAPNGNAVATLSPTRSTVIVDIGTLSVRDLGDYGQLPSAASFASDGVSVAVGYDDGRVRRLRPGSSSADTLFELPGASPVLDITYIPDGRLVAANAHAVAAWNDATRQLSQRPLRGRSEARAVVIDPEGRGIAVLGQDGELQIQGPNGAVGRTLRCGTSAPPAVSREGDVACAGFSASALRLPGSGKGDLASPLHEGPHAITSIAFSPDGRVVATGSNDGLIDLWNANNGTLLIEHALQAGDGPVEALRFDATGSRLAAVVQGRLSIWPVESKAPIEQKAPVEQAPVQQSPVQQQAPNQRFQPELSRQQQQVPQGQQSPVQQQVPPAPSPPSRLQAD